MGKFNTKDKHLKYAFDWVTYPYHKAMDGRNRSKSSVFKRAWVGAFMSVGAIVPLSLATPDPTPVYDLDIDPVDPNHQAVVEQHVESLRSVNTVLSDLDKQFYIESYNGAEPSQSLVDAIELNTLKRQQAERKLVDAVYASPAMTEGGFEALHNMLNNEGLTDGTYFKTRENPKALKECQTHILESGKTVTAAKVQNCMIAPKKRTRDEKLLFAFMGSAIGMLMGVLSLFTLPYSRRRAENPPKWKNYKAPSGN